MSSFEPFRSEERPPGWKPETPESVEVSASVGDLHSYLPDYAELRPVSGASAGAGEVNTQDVEASIEAARIAGEQAGFAKGRSAEAERLYALMNLLEDIVDKLRQSDEQREQQATERSTALAIGVAGRLIQREVKTSPEIVLELVRQAVSEFPVVEPLSVHLNPADMARLSSDSLGHRGRDLLSTSHTVRWLSDPDIRSGGCLVEGVERVMDGRLLHNLERVLEALTDG
jgi:flagellar assembly protein FliH